jgi:hypothetical protein
MSYIIERCSWCNIIVLNIHTPTEDKGEELEHVFNQFLKYHMKMLHNFNAKVGRGDIFNPTIGKVSLHEISNDNTLNKVSFSMSKKSVKNTLFVYYNIHKYSCDTDHYLVVTYLRHCRVCVCVCK